MKTRIMRLRGVIVALLVALLLTTSAVYAAPAMRSTFDWIITQKLTVMNGGMTIWGAVDFDGALNVDGASTLNSTLDVDGATTLNSTLDVDGNVTSGTGSFTITDSVNATGAVDFDSTLNVDGNTTLNGTLDVGGAISSDTGAITLTDASGVVVTTGGLSISDGDFVAADDVRVTAQSAISVTDGGIITPTGTYQPLESAGTVTATIAAGTAGDMLVLINTTATTINIEDTGNQVLTAAAALGQYDSLTLWADGTRWIELSRADN